MSNCRTSILQAEREKTKGKGWFDMPAQEMTEEKKNTKNVWEEIPALKMCQNWGRMSLLKCFSAYSIPLPGAAESKITFQSGTG